MSIKADLEELHHINIEIKRLLGVMKGLRKTKASVEKRILEYLAEKDLPGVKYNGYTILVKKNTKDVYVKPKKARHQELLELLKTSGINDPESFLKKIKDIGKAEKVKQSVQMHENNN